MADNPEEKEEAKEEAPEEAKAAGGGGIKAMLPLIMTLVLMPVLAYCMTSFVLLPKLQQAVGGGGGGGDGHGDSGDGHGDGGHGETQPGGHDPGGHGGGPINHGGALKEKVQFAKLITNVKDTRGTKLLLTSFTAAGTSSRFKDKVEENMDQLTDLALSILGNKTISDLEKPESRNIIRSELMSQFNAALGNGVVQEVYITELAIQ